MKIDVSVVLKDLESKEIKIQKPVGDKVELVDMRLKDACKEALMGIYDDEKQVSGQEKFDRYQLATKIVLADADCDLTVEEISKIKSLIGKSYGPAIVGPVYSLLEKKIFVI